MKLRTVILSILLSTLTVVSIVSYYVVTKGNIAQAAEEKVSDLFDPVCGMKVDKDTAAATSEYEGATYYFCSKECKAHFEKDPKKFACICARGGMPGCNCDHCQKKAARCDCESEKKEHEHKEGEHHH